MNEAQAPHSADNRAAAEEASGLSPERATLLALTKRGASGHSLASLSRALGRNAAYLHQYVTRGSPRLLPESERYQLATLLGIDESALRPEDQLVGRPAMTDIIEVPILSLRPAAGHASFADGTEDSTPFAFPASFVRSLAPHGVHQLALLHVRGHSMAPILADGDMIMLDQGDESVRNPEQYPPHPEGIYVLDDGLGLVVKHLSLVSGPEGPKWRIISANGDYPSYRARLDEVRLLGRVIWISRQI